MPIQKIREYIKLPPNLGSDIGEFFGRFIGIMKEMFSVGFGMAREIIAEVGRKGLKL